MIFGGNIMAKLKTGRHTSALKEARKAEKYLFTDIFSI